MPTLYRRPAGEIEDRIDFERIASAQDRRHRDTLSELRGLLVRIERRTIAYALEELARKKRKTAVAKYSMPLSNKYREIVRRRMLSAYRRGKQDVAAEIGARKAPAMTSPEMSSVRAQADVVVRDHKERIETDLRKAWTQAMVGPIDKEQIVYVTRKAFADFAGWEQPIP